MIIHAMTQPVALPSGACALPQLGVIAAEGPDAASFLHGQLTQDFALLGATEARLAALCTAKGRVIASFVGIRPQPETILLVCSRDILAATLKRLSMYVLRAKAKLSDATEQFALYGLAGTALAANGLDAAALPGQRTAIGNDISAVSLYPADGVPRAMWIAPAGSPVPAGPSLDAQPWQWSEVRSGIVTVTTPVIEAFVPQMINYESVGGVNFKKGCYPGQEIVARSQYRGTLKRRLQVFETDGQVAVGQEIFHSADPEQPAGVVAGAGMRDGRSVIAAEIKLAALEGGSLHLGSAAGSTLQPRALPYEIPPQD